MAMPSALFDLRGHNALVTGASKGLGRAMAAALARAGATVALCARDREGLAATKALCEREGGRAEVFPMDVLDAASVRAGVAAAIERLGHLDVLVNNAGVNIRKPALELSEAEWDTVVD